MATVRHPKNGGLHAYLQHKLRERPLSHMSPALLEACEALTKYPRHVQTAEDAGKLQGFDDDVLQLAEDFFFATSQPRSPLQSVADNTQHRTTSGGKRKREDGGNSVRTHHHSGASPSVAGTATATGAERTASTTTSSSEIVELLALLRQSSAILGGDGSGGGGGGDAPGPGAELESEMGLDLDSGFDFRPLSERMADRGAGGEAVVATAAHSATLGPYSTSIRTAAGQSSKPPHTASTSAVTATVTATASSGAGGESVRATGPAIARAHSTYNPSGGSAGGVPTVKRATSGPPTSSASGSGGASVSRDAHVRGATPAMASASVASVAASAGVVDVPEAWTCPHCTRHHTSGIRTNHSTTTQSTSSTRTTVSASTGSTDSVSASSRRLLNDDGAHPIDPTKWELVLLLDNREVRSRTDRSYLQSQLLSKGVSCEVRQLPLGDITWVIKRKVLSPSTSAHSNSHTNSHTVSRVGFGGSASLSSVHEEGFAFSDDDDEDDGGDSDKDDASSRGITSTHGKPANGAKGAKGKKPTTKKKRKGGAASDSEGGGVGCEFMTNYIVERKGVADLAASIVDGRYAEQKLRLAAAGQRVTYIVEGDPTKLNEGAAYGALISSKHILGAIVSTQILSQCRVVLTTTLDATVTWLTSMTQAIASQLFGSRPQVHGAPSTISASASGDGVSGGSFGLGGSSVLQLAATGVSPTTTVRGHTPHVPAGGDEHSLLMSQSTTQMAAIETRRVVWPVGAGLSAASRSSTLPSTTSIAANGSALGMGSLHGPAAGGGGEYRVACTHDRCRLWGHIALHPAALPYTTWAVQAAKPRALSTLHLFGRMLRQVQGCSADRAQAVLDVYPTPSALLDAFDALTPLTAPLVGPKLLQGLPIPRQKNSLGPALARTLHELYCAAGYRDPPAASRTGSGGGGCGATSNSSALQYDDAEIEDAFAASSVAAAARSAATASATSSTSSRGSGGSSYGGGGGWRGRGGGGGWRGRGGRR